jgi:hypothetical protein
MKMIGMKDERWLLIYIGYDKQLLLPCTAQIARQPLPEKRSIGNSGYGRREERKWKGTRNISHDEQLH